MGKVIGNIGVLDITTASEESIKGIDRIINLGMLIYSSKTSGLVSKLSIGNLGTSMEVPEDYKLIQGHVDMDKNYFKNIKEPLSLVVMGHIIIKPDTAAEDIEKGIKDIIINGKAICPEHLLSVFRSKCSKVNGKIISYTGNCFVKMGKTEINNSFLNSLEDDTCLALIGKVSFVDDVDMELFSRKVKKVDIIGMATVKEEYMQHLSSKLQDMSQCMVEVIPEGYVYVNDDLHLDQISIRRFDRGKLYVSGMIYFDSSITGEILKRHVDKIIAKEVIVCSKEIKEDVYGLCDCLSTKICDYSNKVVIVDGERRLTQWELKYSPSSLTYVVKGELTISNDVLPETFMEKVENIDNFGEIICDAEHYGLVQAKIRTSCGEVVEMGNDGDSNIGYLKL